MTQNRPPALSPLERALFALEKMEARLAAAERIRTEPLAVIGIGCRFPGGSEDPEAFWRALREGTEAIREIGAERWPLDAAHGAAPTPRRAGLLDAVDGFDAAFFGLSRSEAAGLDPQHRLLLELAWEALEDAAQPIPRLEGSRTGVFFGLSSRDYQDILLGAPRVVEVSDLTGNGQPFAAGRVAHLLGLRGPCLTLDAACASALMAVHFASQSLRRRECDLALAGGAHLILSPRAWDYLEALQILSTDGRCRVLDAGASGFVRAEGGGVIALKRLSDAERDGDPIRALIRGSATTHSGRSTSLTAPSLQAEIAVLKEALEDAGVGPAQVDYVEIHSNGSPLGDVIEVDALTEALGKPRQDGTTCVLGSVKTNFGHAEAASGMASLTKAILSLEHELIPRNLHFRELNPRITLTGTPFAIPVAEVPWRRGGRPRFAGVSAAGISGSQVHAVLQEAPQKPRNASALARPLHLLPLSARSAEALRAQVARLARHLSRHPELALGDVCHTAAAGRTHFEHRLAIVTASPAQALQDLEAFLRGEPRADLVQGHVSRGVIRPKVAFVCTDDLAPLAGVARTLHDAVPPFRAALAECEAVIQPLLGRALTPLLLDDTSAALGDERTRDLALFSVQYALARLWQAWGVKPSAVVGVGVGEFVAAAIAGLFRLEEALALVAARRSPTSYAAELARVRPAGMRIQFLPSARSSESPAALAYWRDLARAPARLDEALAGLSGQEWAAVLLLGPLPTPAAPRAPGAPPFLPPLQRGQSQWAVLCANLAYLYTRGVEVDWTSFDQPFSFRKISLPTYPFQRQRHWIEASPRQAAPGISPDEHSLLGRRLAPLAHQPDTSGWELLLDPPRVARLELARVAGLPILSLEALSKLAQLAWRAEVGDVPGQLSLSADAPILLGAGAPSLQVIVQTSDAGNGSVQLFFRPAERGRWQPIARGTLEPRAALAPSEILPSAPPGPDAFEELPPSAWQDALAALGVAPRALRMARVWRKDGESLAHLSGGQGDPELIAGALLQAAAALASLTHPADARAPWLPGRVERLRIHAQERAPAWVHLVWSAAEGGEAMVDAAWFAADGSLVADARAMRLVAADLPAMLQRAGDAPLSHCLYERVWVERPLAAPTPRGRSEPRHFLILADRGGLGVALAERLRAQGHAITSISEEELERSPERLDLALGTNRTFTDVVHLHAVERPSGGAPLRDAYRTGVETALRLASIARTRPRPPRFWCVTRGAEPIAGAPPAVEAALLRGLGRALAQEHPALWGGAIDLDPQPAPEDPARLTEVLTMPDQEDQVAFRGGIRLAPRLTPRPAEGPGVPLALRADRAYLVTNGLGELGLLVVRRLVERGARMVVLASAAEQSPTATGAFDAAVRALAALGAEVRLEAADVADPASMERLLARLPLPLGGVVHLAGAAGASTTLFDRGAAEVLAVAFRADVLGCHVLHELTQALPLDFFVMLGSTAHVRAPGGRAYQAIADHFMAALAQLRRARGLAGCSIHAPPLASGATSPELARSAWRAGLLPLPAGVVLDALERALHEGRTEVSVAWLDAELIAARRYAEGPDMLLADAAPPLAFDEAAGAQDLSRLLVLAGPSGGRRLLGDLLRAHCMRSLDRAPAELPEEQPLAELGMDSIRGVQLANSLSRTLGVPLPAALLVEHPTLAALAEHLAARLRSGADGAGAPPGASAPWRYSPLLPLRKTGARPPLFCVHPLMGLAVVFQSLALHLGSDQPFYGLQARGVDTDDPPVDSIEDMAALYLQAVREVQPVGPYRLAGYSFGSCVALEMAQQLARGGEAVERLVFLDAPAVSPQEGGYSPYTVFVRWLGYDVDEREFAGLTAREQALRVARNMAHLMMLPPDIAESRRQLDVYAAHFHAGLTYVPRPYAGRITLVRAEGTRTNANLTALDPLYGWSSLALQPIETHDVPGTHFNMIFEPHVRQLAATLRLILDGARGP
nr:KR domain-containing protein [Myxococcales bacterium]